MERISLDEFVKKIGQARVARALGVKPASIAKALKYKRKIEITIGDDGKCMAQETRPFPYHVHDIPEAEQATAAHTL